MLSESSLRSRPYGYWSRNTRCRANYYAAIWLTSWLSYFSSFAIVAMEAELTRLLPFLLAFCNAVALRSCRSCAYLARNYSLLSSGKAEIGMPSGFWSSLARSCSIISAAKSAARSLSASSSYWMALAFFFAFSFSINRCISISRKSSSVSSGRSW